MLKSWLDENGPILDLLGEAVRKPTFCMPLIRKDPKAPLVESLGTCQIQTTRSFARSLAARANYRLGTGDIEGAMYDAISQKRLGRHLQRNATVVEYLIGIAVEGIGNAIGVAAVRERQPTEEQLRRFLAELQASPQPWEMDRLRLGDRYNSLDWLQSVALGQRRLAENFRDEMSSPGIAQRLTLDWNVLMQRVNTHYDTWDQEFHAMPFRQLSLGNLFIGARSRHVADCLAFGFQPAHRALEEARRRTNCSNNLHQIALGMLLYHHERGTLPPAYTIDANGKPLHSWRVLLLPYVGEEKLFSQIRVAEPWNSVHNCQFHDAAVAIYQCPSALAKPGETTYSVVVGQHAAFRPAESRSLDDLGMKLVLVVERRTPVCWMDPTSELTEAISLKGTKSRSEGLEGIGSQHPGGTQAAMRDGSTRFLSRFLEATVLQSLLDGTAKEWPQ